MIQQGWTSAANPQHVLDIYENTDAESREHLLFVLNGLNQLKLYPLKADWTVVEGYGVWNQFHYSASYDDLRKVAAQIVLILLEVLVEAELELASDITPENLES